MVWFYRKAYINMNDFKLKLLLASLTGVVFSFIFILLAFVLPSKDVIIIEKKADNKLGEISARMVRMETVKSHDEDYFVQLDQRISNDVDIDLSEAIMRLTRLSTSYQAALQN